MESGGWPSAHGRPRPRGVADTGPVRCASIGRSWIGSWYGAGRAEGQRKVGPARTPGERDGLTKPQAEERFRAMRASRRAARPRSSG